MTGESGRNTLAELVAGLQRLTLLLEQHSNIIHTCMVDFLVLDHWALLPAPLQVELLALSDNELAELPGQAGAGDQPHPLDTPCPVLNSYPVLTETLEAVQRCQLARVCRVESWSGADCEPLHHWDAIMPPKKQHEVGRMAELVVNTMQQAGAGNCLLDLGSGLGYLGQVLARLHSCTVLGVEGQAGNTKGAQARQENMDTKWAGLAARAGQRKEGQQPSSRRNRRKAKQKLAEESGGETVIEAAVNEGTENMAGRYVAVTQFVEEGEDVGLLVAEHFPGEDRFGVVGLHTCGDLAPTSLRAFIASPGAAVLCNVGCCYNWLSDAGFPLSAALQVQYSGKILSN